MTLKTKLALEMGVARLRIRAEPLLMREGTVMTPPFANVMSPPVIQSFVFGLIVDISNPPLNDARKKAATHRS